MEAMKLDGSILKGELYFNIKEKCLKISNEMLKVNILLKKMYIKLLNL